MLEWRARWESAALLAAAPWLIRLRAGDGVVAGPCSVDDPGSRVENIEVQANLLDLSMNLLALYAAADRLAQDPASWRAFDALGARRWFDRTHHAAEVQAGLA
jgi:hypothetical protein